MITETDSRPPTLWDQGDYSVVGARLAPMAEDLCDTAELRGGLRVLDVATGNGNAAICAARRDGQVIAVDTAVTLLDRARHRSSAEGLDIDYRWGDAERLEFADDSFDAVVSCVGVQFAADQHQAARELVRVCRAGGTIAMSNWSPLDFWTELPGILSRYAPPPPGAPSPMTWGTLDGLRSLFGDHASIELVPRTFRYHFATVERYVDTMLEAFPPFAVATRTMDDATQTSFRNELCALTRRWNRSAESLDLPLTYVIALVTPAR